MTNCPSDLAFSAVHASKRRGKAGEALGSDVVDRIVAFGLFLLGAKREEIARFLGMPMGTLLSFLTRMNTHGLAGFEDRRSSEAPSPGVPKAKKQPCCSVKKENGYLRTSIGSSGVEFTMPAGNRLQCKAVLFTLLDNGLVAASEVAKAVGLSRRRVRDLTAAMREKDLPALLDRRKGQEKDYRFTPEIKSELVQQFALNALSGQPTSGRAIAEDLQRRCEMELSERSVRLHLNKLGLFRIADSLPELLEAQKKTSSES